MIQDTENQALTTFQSATLEAEETKTGFVYKPERAKDWKLSWAKKPENKGKSASLARVEYNKYLLEVSSKNGQLLGQVIGSGAYVVPRVSIGKNGNISASLKPKATVESAIAKAEKALDKASGKKSKEEAKALLKGKELDESTRKAFELLGISFDA